uniref:CHK kinase-like domain-containing protein n=1 Tax=Acrobeloides nanus TaxID=290746 RepID=A0A914E0F4_9BILA
MEFPIAGYSLDRVLQIIHENDRTQREILSQNQVKDAVLLDLNQNRGFASKIFRVQIFFEDSSVAPVTFVIKIPTTESFKNVLQGKMDSTDTYQESDVQITIEDVMKMHNRECMFYETFNHCEILPKPKIFHIEKSNFEENTTGIILMEDLCFWTRSPLIYTSLTENMVLSIVGHLTNFHAYQLENRQVWKNKFEDCVFFQTFDAKFSRVMLKKLTSILPGMFEDLIQSLSKTICDNNFTEFAVRGCCQQIGIPSVVCLGDLWSSNILKPKHYDDNGFSLKDEVRAFIDFQLCFEGNPAFDIARLVTLCTDAEGRRSLEEKMFHVYCDALKNSLTSQENDLFTPEKIKLAYKYAMVHQAVGLALAIPIFYNTLKNVKDQKWATENIGILVTRAKNALQDAIVFLQENDSKWL